MYIDGSDPDVKNHDLVMLLTTSYHKPFLACCVVFQFEEGCLTRVFPWSDMIHRLNDRLMLRGIVSRDLSEEEVLQVLSNKAATGELVPGDGWSQQISQGLRDLIG